MACRRARANCRTSGQQDRRTAALELAPHTRNTEPPSGLISRKPRLRSRPAGYLDNAGPQGAGEPVSCPGFSYLEPWTLPINSRATTSCHVSQRAGTPLARALDFCPQLDWIAVTAVDRISSPAKPEQPH